MIPRVIHPMTLTPEELRAVALDAAERADKPLGAPEVSPAVEAAFAAGRQAGLLEAAALLRGAAGLLGDSQGASALRCGAEEIEALVARTGGA